MKKRTICLLLAMIMVLSIVLAGCSKTAETPAADETPATTEPAETTDNTETPEAPEETAEPALEQKTIQLMITGAASRPTPTRSGPLSMSSSSSTFPTPRLNSSTFPSMSTAKSSLRFWLPAKALTSHGPAG